MTSKNSKAQDVQALEAQDNTSAVEAQATFTVEDVAQRLNVEAKDLRRWLRARAHATHGKAKAQADVLPGKGKRYTFDDATADAIVSAYGKAKGASGRAVSADAFGLTPSTPSQQEGAPVT